MAYQSQIVLPRNSIIGYDSRTDTLKHKKDVYENMDTFIKEFERAVNSSKKFRHNYFDVLALVATRNVQNPAKLSQLKEELRSSNRNGPIVFSMIDNLVHDFSTRNLEVDPKNIKTELDYRAFTHDNSKIENPDEKSFLDFMGPRDQTNPEYGTPYYYERSEQFRKLHYLNNPHHPEHFANGIMGMSLIDFIEMLCDTNAARIKYGNGNVAENILDQAGKYQFTDNCLQMSANTNKRLELIEPTTRIILPEEIRRGL